MYQPPWSVLYKALSQSSDHLYEAHFTDKEADINPGWDEKETSSRGPQPSGHKCPCFKLILLSVLCTRGYPLLDTDFQQLQFARSHIGTGGPVGVVSQVRGLALLTLRSRGTSPLLYLHPGGELGGYKKCGLGLRVWGIRTACLPIRDANRRRRRGGSGHSFWTTLEGAIPVFPGLPVRVGRHVSIKLRS